MKCTNDFQTVTTKPFMVDVQCDEASVEIVPPQTLQSGWSYNTLLQTYEATIDQGTIYFEFPPWKTVSQRETGNPACPIIQYRVTDIKVLETNHHPSTPNYIYARPAGSDYVYEHPSTTLCTNGKATTVPSTGLRSWCWYRQMPMALENRTDNGLIEDNWANFDLENINNGALHQPAAY